MSESSKKLSKTSISENVDSVFRNQDIEKVTRLIQAHFQQILSLVDGTTLSDVQKIHLYREATSELFSKIDALLPTPKKADLLYKNRDDKKETPINFVKLHYSKYLGKNLTLAHLRQFDFYLYTQILKQRSQLKGHWPSGFYLPTKEEATSRELEQLSEFEKKRLIRLRRKS